MSNSNIKSLVSSLSLTTTITVRKIVPWNQKTYNFFSKNYAKVWPLIRSAFTPSESTEIKPGDRTITWPSSDLDQTLTISFKTLGEKVWSTVVLLPPSQPLTLQDTLQKNLQNMMTPGFKADIQNSQGCLFDLE